MQLWHVLPERAAKAAAPGDSRAGAPDLTLFLGGIAEEEARQGLPAATAQLRAVP